MTNDWLPYRQAREEEKEENRRLAELYTQRLEAEDKARRDAFNKRMEKIDAMAKWSDEGPLGRGRREEEQRFELMLLREQQAKEARDAKRELDDALVCEFLVGNTMYVLTLCVLSVPSGKT